MAYKLKPVFLSKIWGGNKLQELFGYDTEPDCGECWGISGYENTSSVIMNGEFAGKTLRELYIENRDLFGNYDSYEFPILVKLIDAQSDLSIQVHPNDKYAQKHHNSLGKTECWYIIDTDKDTNIIIGHNAKNKDELIEKIKQNDYESILNKFPIHPGDVFDINAGTIHAICKGTVLLEVQQASDVTYRFYDYNRLQNGAPRELHVEKALDVIDIPSRDTTHSGSTDYFTMDIQTVEKETMVAHKYGDYFVVLDGQGKIDDLNAKKGDFIFVPSEVEYQIDGDLCVAFIQIK